MALEHADYAQKALYEKEAQEIDRIQSDILQIAQNEQPYDIFISYKEKAPDGERTRSSVLAQDVYNHLQKAGYRVFFSRISLEDKVGQKYEPYIYSALNSSKVMLVIGTQKDEFMAPWVHNEWSRFLAMMREDTGKLLIPCFRDLDIDDLPNEFQILQSQDMSKIGFEQDLIHGIEKACKNNKDKEEKQTAVRMQDDRRIAVKSLLDRAFICMQDGDFTKADNLLEQALNINYKHILEDGDTDTGNWCRACNVELINKSKETINKKIAKINSEAHIKISGIKKNIFDLENNVRYWEDMLLRHNNKKRNIRIRNNTFMAIGVFLSVIAVLLYSVSLRGCINDGVTDGNFLIFVVSVCSSFFAFPLLAFTPNSRNKENQKVDYQIAEALRNKQHQEQLIQQAQNELRKLEIQNDYIERKKNQIIDSLLRYPRNMISRNNITIDGVERKCWIEIEKGRFTCFEIADI